jgi:hypothetical protein
MLGRVLSLIVLSLALTSLTLAGSLGVDFTSVGGQADLSYWSLGYEFTANSAVSVVGLGTFDYGQDGLAGPQQVGLWDASEDLLASAFVDNSDPLQGFWRFAAISPVTLVPGDTYYVASQGGEGYAFYANGFMVNPDITFVEDAYQYVGTTSNSPLTFPGQSEGITVAEGGGIFGGNVEFGSAIPEPGTCLLIAPVLFGFAALRRKLPS